MKHSLMFKYFPTVYNRCLIFCTKWLIKNRVRYTRNSCYTLFTATSAMQLMDLISSFIFGMHLTRVPLNANENKEAAALFRSLEFTKWNPRK